MFYSCSSTILIFSDSSLSKSWLAFQAVPTHWSQLWNMLVNTNYWSKHLSWQVTYSLQWDLFLNTMFQSVPWTWADFGREWKFSTRKVHWITHAYTNCAGLFQSSTFLTLFWKTVSELLWGWTKTTYPVILLLEYLCLAFWLGEEHVRKALSPWSNPLINRGPFLN